MKSALVIHGDIYRFGGAENFAVKLIRILLDHEINVTLLHSGGALDDARIRNQFGVELKSSSVRFIQAQPFDRLPGIFNQALLLRYAFVLRQAQKCADKYDFVIGTYGEVPINARNIIQAVHIPFFFFDRESLRYLSQVQTSSIRHLIRIAYVITARVIAGWSRDKVSRHLLITNSRWTAGQFQRHYPQARIETIYHGVTTKIFAGHNDYLTHSQRNNTIVTIGRVVPFKRVHLAIQIIDGLRARGHQDLSLLIIGSGTGKYADEIADMQASRPYVNWLRDLPRLEMERLVAQQRWGLHTAEYEHYGLSPLELQRLGCVTFVHDSGGQVEPVKEPNLKYQNLSDAIDKMDKIIRNPAQSQRLFESLPTIVMKHTTEEFQYRFINRIRDLGFIDT
jgi:glycosyltransferase involved in cell wall biosynthesis